MSESHVHIESEVDVAGGLPAADAPALGRQVPDDHGHVIARNLELGDAVDHLGVQPPFRVDGYWSRRNPLFRKISGDAARSWPTDSTSKVTIV